MKIAILIPYFGKWPEWINLYLFSCGRNKDVDWFFFTDCPVPRDVGENLHFYEMSFQDYCENVSNKLEIDFRPENPYKLCGLRPFYGYIHQELIEGYDFWGWGDVDVIWGDIKSFYPDELLGKYDVFSTQADRLSGHLTIIRNERKYVDLAFRIKDWQEKLLSDRLWALDEVDYARLLYPQSWYIQKFYARIIRKIFNWRDAWVIYNKLLPVLNACFFIKKRKLFFKEQYTTPILYNDGLIFKHDSDSWIYKDGKMWNAKNKREYIYLHFMIFKKNIFRTDHFWDKGCNKIADGYDLDKGFLINRQGFLPVV